jgi:hypothetical protein
VFAIYAAIPLLLAILLYLLRKTAFANGLLLLLTLSLCFTGLEAYYRFYYCRSDGFGRLMKNFSDRYYRFDAYGLRSSNLPLSKTQQNFVVVGDSHVFGAGLKRTTDRFSERLADHYRNLHVINLGYPGWDTKTEVQQLRKYADPEARVDLVILTYFFNDIEEDATEVDRGRISGPIQPPQPTAIDRALQWISQYSRFVELFYFRIGYPRLVRDRLGQIQTFYKDPAVRDRHLAALEEFRREVEQHYGAHLLVVILPFLHSTQLLNATPLYQGFDESLQQRGFRYIDMQPVFSTYGIKQLQVNRWDPHTNPLANRLVANAIIGYLDAHPDLLRPNTRER